MRHGPRPTAQGPRDTLHQPLFGQLFGAVSVILCQPATQYRLRPLRRAQPWRCPWSGARGGALDGAAQQGGAPADSADDTDGRATGADIVAGEDQEDAGDGDDLDDGGG